MKNLVLTLEELVSAFWGIPALLLFVGGGIYVSFRLRFIQFRLLPEAFRSAFRSTGTGQGNSSLSAFLASLGAVMGPGNIVGVASAVVMGGPGAIFWMWVSAWVGMALRYAESALAVKYRVLSDGVPRGGAMYIFKAKNMPFLALLFSVSGIIVSLTMADAVPSAAVGNALKSAWGLSPKITGIILTLFTAIVLFGGSKRILRVSEIMVPLICVFYFAIASAVFILNPSETFRALWSIFRNAFSLRAGLAGLIGGAVRHGLSKGVFSHEAGMGTDPILAASTDQEDFHVQGLISMLGPFLDTVVFCSLTALVVLVHNGVESDPSLVTRAAFSGFFPVCGGWAVDAVLLLLVLATLSSWAFYGEACVFYLSKRPVWKVLYRVIYCIVPLISAGADLSGLIVLGDGATAFMAVPNVVLCLLFICEVKSTKESRFIGTSNIDKIL